MWPDSLRFLDLTLPTLAENLALDEVLLKKGEDDPQFDCLRIWEWTQPAVVVGSSNRIDREVDRAACRRDNVPILRRCSGGGAVLLGPGCLLYSLILKTSSIRPVRDVTAAIDHVLVRLVNRFKPFVPGIRKVGTSDLAIDDRKVSGNSQRWLRRAFLHHGTLLYGFPIDSISNYLRMPSRKPEYRDDRPHDDFVTNLPLDGEVLRSGLASAFNADCPLSHNLNADVEELVRRKYGTTEWNERL